MQLKVRLAIIGLLLSVIPSSSRAEDDAAVNQLLGATHRVGMTNRPMHAPTVESNEQIYLFFEHFLKP